MKYKYLLKYKYGFWEKNEKKFVGRRCNINRGRRCKSFPSCKSCLRWLDK